MCLAKNRSKNVDLRSRNDDTCWNTARGHSGKINGKRLALLWSRGTDIVGTLHVDFLGQSAGQQTSNCYVRPVGDTEHPWDEHELLAHCYFVRCPRQAPLSQIVRHGGPGHHKSKMLWTELRQSSARDDVNNLVWFDRELSPTPSNTHLHTWVPHAGRVPLLPRCMAKSENIGQSCRKLHHTIDMHAFKKNACKTFQRDTS